MHNSACRTQETGNVTSSAGAINTDANECDWDTSSLKFTVTYGEVTRSIVGFLREPVAKPATERLIRFIAAARQDTLAA